LQLSLGDTCFVCGKENPEGLRLEFQLDEKSRSIETTWVPSERYQGYRGVLHGGMVATLLDEAVAKLSTLLGKPAVTAELSVRYLKPVPIGRPLRIRGQIAQEKLRLLLGEAEAILEDGSIAATAFVKLVRERT
jgi:uncharacterized protein (TIGR00369 family)